MVPKCSSNAYARSNGNKMPEVQNDKNEGLGC